MKPWIKAKLKNIIREKEILFNQWKNNRDDLNLKNAYKNCRNKLTSLVRKEFHKYYLEQFQENSDNIKKMWTLSDELIGKKSGKLYQKF